MVKKVQCNFRLYPATKAMLAQMQQEKGEDLTFLIEKMIRQAYANHEEAKKAQLAEKERLAVTYITNLPQNLGNFGEKDSQPCEIKQGELPRFSGEDSAKKSAWKFVEQGKPSNGPWRFAPKKVMEALKR